MGFNLFKLRISKLDAMVTTQAKKTLLCYVCACQTNLKDKLCINDLTKVFYALIQVRRKEHIMSDKSIDGCMDRGREGWLDK